MRTRPTTLRIPAATREGIELAARRSGRDFSGVANEMLSEGVKMRRVPGVLFADSARGRVAQVAGSGLAVFEVVKAYREVEGDWVKLQAAYHWLSERQLRSALAYAEAYSDEIERALAEDAGATPEEVWRRYPFTRPAVPDLPRPDQP